MSQKKIVEKRKSLVKTPLDNPLKRPPTLLERFLVGVVGLSFTLTIVVTILVARLPSELGFAEYSKDMYIRTALVLLVIVTYIALCRKMNVPVFDLNTVNTVLDDSFVLPLFLFILSFWIVITFQSQNKILSKIRQIDTDTQGQHRATLVFIALNAILDGLFFILFILAILFSNQGWYFLFAMLK